MLVLWRSQSPGCNGYILISTLVIISCLLLLGMFLLDHFLLQTRINENLYLEMKTYYLAWAGVEYGMACLNEDINWRVMDYSLNLDSDGEVGIEVTDYPPFVLIRSIGHYRGYQYIMEAYVTKTLPVRRIK